MRSLVRAVFTALLLALPWASPAQAPAPAPFSTTLAPGVSYRHIQSKTPAGEPWSIHVLEMSRREKAVELRAVEGRDTGGAMVRVLPTALAGQAAAAGMNVVAVVNGDYDLPAPHLGVSDGLAVTSREIWTTGKPTWPNFALLKDGEPVIAVPEVKIELQRGKQRWAIAALNKPFGAAWGEGLRLYTRQFRPTVKSERPFTAVVIGKLSRPLPLRADATVKGIVIEVRDSVPELPIPADAIVLASRASADSATTISSLRKGDKVKLDLRVRMAGHNGVRHAIGGFPIIAREGRSEVVGEPGANLKLRHPRTAVCYNTEKIIFAVVDGRQPQLSVGMTLEELGDLMVSLGCTTAMNTDGGGSSVIAIAPPVATTSTGGGARHAAPLRIVNSPSDGRERGRGNAWVVVAKP